MLGIPRYTLVWGARYTFICAYEKFTKRMKWQTGEVGVILAALNVLL